MLFPIREKGPSSPSTLTDMPLLLLKFPPVCTELLQKRRDPFAPDQVFDGFAFADDLEPVPLDHHLGHPGTAVVAARHRKTVGAGRHEGNQIILLEHRDFTPLYQEVSR